MNVIRSLEAILADLRYALRQLRLNPGFAAVAVLSLALGIGANTAIFQLLNGIMFHELPVKNPSELAVITPARPFFTAGWSEGRHRVFSYSQYDQMRVHQKAFADLMAFGTTRFNLNRSGEARYAEGLWVTKNFLSVLGVSPFLGNGFPPSQNESDCSGAGAIISYGFWQSEFGGRTNVLSSKVETNGISFPVLGVTPPGFQGVEPARTFDIALPICAEALFDRDKGKGRMPNQTAFWLTPLGRLNPAWTVERAAAHIRQVSPAIFQGSLPTSYRPDGAKKYLANKLNVVSGAAGVSSLRQEYSMPLLMLLAIAGCVLLIACANLANILLARASAREREMAVRQAVGASRTRLVSQLLLESLTIVSIGAALGAVLAQTLSRTMMTFLAASDTRLITATPLDWRVFAFVGAVSAFACVLFGLVPALRATGVAPASAMRGGRTSTASGEKGTLRRALVVAQIALSVVLVVGAVMFARSLQNLLVTSTGIRSQGVVVADIEARSREWSTERRKLAFNQLLEGIRSQPAVESAATVSITPFSGSGWNQDVFATDPAGAEVREVSWFNRVGPGYFDTLKTPIVAGRDVSDHDTLQAPNVAVVNEEFARTILKTASPLGKTFRIEQAANEPDKVFQVVGLVRNTKYYNLREEFKAIAYLPMAQDDGRQDSMTFVVRARGNINDVTNIVRQQLERMGSEMLVEFRVLDLQVQESILREKLVATLSSGFGLLASLLSMVGLYGVASYTVARRQSEIGIRMALGAGRGAVLGMILRDSGRLVAIGLVIGLFFAVLLSRYAEALLYGLKPADPATLIIASALLATTALVASWLPADRASRLDPAAVLRTEG